MKRLLLVVPKNPGIRYSDMKGVPYLTKKIGTLNVGLATVAALTPKKEFKIEIVDEAIDSIDYNKPYDIVGITGFPSYEISAERIAKEFRKRGALVVCGGSAATLSPERWRPFSDVLILGEAEQIWPEFLRDYLTGQYKKEYREEERFDLDISPVPDYSGFSKKLLKLCQTGIMQTSRGCPYNCEFCDVITYVGRKMRYKPVGKILKEIELLYRMGFRRVFIADDNFPADRKKSKEILQALRNWNQQKRSPVLFSAQLSIDMAKDEELLELAAEAGLYHTFIGVETPNIDSLKEVGKLHNVHSNMLEDVKKFNQHGIFVTGSSIVGFDHDDLSIFQQHYDFYMESSVPNIYCYPLQAPDGSALKERVIKEGRYRGWNPLLDPESVRNLRNLSIIPKQISIEQLSHGIQWLLWQLYRPENVARRLERFFENFENSPKRHKLRIPKRSFDWTGFGIFLRMLKYIFTKAPVAERQAFQKMFDYARNSSHPQASLFTATAFIIMKNIHGLLNMLYPGIEEISYPA